MMNDPVTRYTNSEYTGSYFKSNIAPNGKTTIDYFGKSMAGIVKQHGL